MAHRRKIIDGVQRYWKSMGRCLRGSLSSEKMTMVFRKGWRGRWFAEIDPLLPVDPRRCGRRLVYRR
jgi:hypothetical protein